MKGTVLTLTVAIAAIAVTFYFISSVASTPNPSAQSGTCTGGVLDYFNPLCYSFTQPDTVNQALGQSETNKIYYALAALAVVIVGALALGVWI